MEVSFFFKGRPNRSAFSRDVLVHSEGLYRYALRLTRNEAEAEDLVQEALLKAYRAYGRTRADSNHRAWVFTILRNEFISRGRRAGREIAVAETDHHVDTAPQLAFADRWEDRMSDEVMFALDQLGELHRSVIVLCDIEGLSYQEISQVLACPIGTVRSRIFHARRQLREQLKVYARQFGMEDIHEAV